MLFSKHKYVSDYRLCLFSIRIAVKNRSHFKNCVSGSMILFAGHMYLVYLLIGMLKENAPSRIVVVSSDLHRLCSEIRFHDLMFEETGSYKRMGWTAYNHSKLCNLLFVREMAKRLHGKITQMVFRKDCASTFTNGL